MSIQKKKTKPTRRHYSPEFKAEALGLAEQVGVSGAAKQLGLHESQLYTWRKKARYEASRSETERELAAENVRLKRQVAKQAEELAILKKGGRVLREKPEMKYAFMHGNKDQFSISVQCLAFRVSRSGYYAWRHRQGNPSKRQLEREKLDRLVARAFAARKGRSGAVGLTMDLDEQGYKYNRKTVAASMKRQGLIAKAARKFKATTDSDHNLPVAPNHLEQDFNATAPNQTWVCDISYLWTGEGWLYLAVVLDLFSRIMDKRMKAVLVCDALQMALWRRRMPKGIIVHSDRGSQYCSRMYQALLAKHDLTCNMSGKGNCYDNAVAESFFHTLKVEMVHGESFATREAMRRAVFEYIEVDYNRTRRHSANGYISPLAFENKMVA